MLYSLLVHIDFKLWILGVRFYKICLGLNVAIPQVVLQNLRKNICLICVNYTSVSKGSNWFHIPHICSHVLRFFETLIMRRKSGLMSGIAFPSNYHSKHVFAIKVNHRIERSQRCVHVNKNVMMPALILVGIPLIWAYESPSILLSLVPGSISTFVGKILWIFG